MTDAEDEVRSFECPLVANNGLSGHVASTSALPPTADLRVSMSAFAPISSASPPGADLPDGAAVRRIYSQRRIDGGQAERWELNPAPHQTLVAAIFVAEFPFEISLDRLGLQELIFTQPGPVADIATQIVLASSLPGQGGCHLVFKT